MEEVKVILDWALGTGDSDDDFLLASGSSLPKLYMQDTIRYEYNQWGTTHCTVYSNIGQLSDLKNVKFSDSDIEEIMQVAYSQGKPVKGWRYTRLGCKAVCDYWNNKHPEDKVAYYRFDIISDIYKEAIKDNYSPSVTYKGNQAYNSDIRDDAIVEGKDFPNPTYGHSVRTANVNEKTSVIDNYKGDTGKGGIDINTYQVPTLNDLVNNGVFYSSCYVILNEKDMAQNIEETKRLKAFEKEIQASIQSNSNQYNMTNSKDYKEFLHNTNDAMRAKLAEVQKQISTFK